MCPPEEDDLLITRAATGDREAFASLVERYGQTVLRVARAITGDDATADDVAQETFLSALRSAATFRPDLGSARTWLLSIARNTARRARRRGREEPTPEIDEPPLLDLGLAAGWGADVPEHAYARAEEIERLARAIAGLASEDREVLVLRDVEQLSGEEAAKVLGLGLAAMKSRLHRARLRLLAALREEAGGVVEREREVGGMTCGAVLAVLGDYVDGDLAAADVTRVDAHLRGCTVCERFGGRYSRTVHAARSRLGAAPTFDPAQMEQIRALLERG